MFKLLYFTHVYLRILSRGRRRRRRRTNKRTAVDKYDINLSPQWEDGRGDVIGEFIIGLVAVVVIKTDDDTRLLLINDARVRVQTVE